MNRPALPPITRVLDRLPVPDPATMAAARTDPADRAAHDRAAAAIPALAAVEYRPPPAALHYDGRLRLVAWNAERLKYGPACAALLGGLQADVILLTETDVGMARSGNRHTTADLATALGLGYAYGVEFVELGLGDAREEAWHRGESNVVGFHGNAILSRWPLGDLALIRLDEGGRWFGDRPDRSKGPGQRRLGGRMALAARLADDGLADDGPVLVSLHLESDSDARDRAAQIQHVLATLASRYGDAPMVIGGDCNTAALPVGPGTDGGADGWATCCEVFEPLFGAMAAAGLDWQAANDMQPTQRSRPDGSPEPPFRRIDWLFTRGLAAAAPRTVAAVDGNGSAVSDHEAIAVELTAR